MKPFLSAFYQHRWLILFSSLYMLAVVTVAAILGASAAEFIEVIKYFLKASVFMLFFPMFLLLIWLLRAFIRAFDRSPGHWLRNALNAFDNQVVEFFQGGQFWAGVAAIVTILPLNIFFCVGKSLIPHLATYSWDPLLASADKAAHFGHYPHELITPLIERFDMGVVVNSLYVLWFLVLFLVQGYCIFADADKVARMRYLWATLFCWAILGTLFALLFASVGPAFYADYYPGTSPYAQLIPHLRESNPDLEVLKLGPAMLEMAHNDNIVNMNAFSAMPSLHVAIAFLTVLYFWNKNRIIAMVAFAYFLVILAGSVYLGWHYALDGYIGTLMVWAAWALTKPLVARLHPEWIRQQTETRSKEA